MKRFFLTLLASTLGVFIAAGLLLFIGIGMLMSIAMSSTKQTVYEPKANTIYKLDLQGSLVEQAQDNPLELLFGNAEKQLGVADVIKAIRNARMNPNIAGIYLNAGNLSAGFASLESIREELKAFKAADKFIVAYADNYTQGTYYLASVADSLFLNPQGTVGLTGLASQGLFFTGLGDKLGIHYEIFKAGKYKSAVEPYMLDKFSDENREQLSSLLNNIWYHWLENIAKDRNTTTGDLNCYANEGRALGEAQNALQFRLADRLCYRFEAENCAKRMAGQPDAEEMRSASTSKLLSMNTYDSTGPDKIAVVYAEGTIMSDANNEGYLETLVSEDIISDLRNLMKKDEVKAVVLRINSPGGDAYLAEQIWKAVADLKAVKPVVVSMGDYAASGGYYIACAANKIVAEPTTLTGSIGVFGMMPNLAGTFQKIGITSDMVKTNAFADLGDLSRPMLPDERLLIQRSVERTYDLFLSRCAEGRGKSKADIDAVAQGRVWTGSQALEVGLVDRLGSMQTAIDEAMALAGPGDYSVYTVNAPKDFWTESMELLMDDAQLSLSRLLMDDETLRLYQAVHEARSLRGIQARMPFWYF